MAPSEATAPSAKLFADALREFIHPAEWMRNRQRELAKAHELHEPPARRGELVEQVEGAWKETQAAWDNVKALAIMPAHPVDDVTPAEWLFRILRDVDVAAELVGGLHAALARQDLTETQDVQFRALITVLRQREIEARNISCVAPQQQEQAPEIPAMTPNEQAIFDVLTAEPMTGADVVAALSREGFSNIDPSALSRACKRPVLKGRGVRHRNGAGYYKISDTK